MGNWFNRFNVHRNNILIYVQQDATLHSLFYLKTALHVSGGSITHHQERKQLYLQHLVFVTPLLLSTAILEEFEPIWVCCGWRTPDDGWWYHPKHVEQFPDKINCVTLHLVGHILEYGWTEFTFHFRSFKRGLKIHANVAVNGDLISAISAINTVLTWKTMLQTELTRSRLSV